jgi:predicted MFS family arabinose efflux permease
MRFILLLGVVSLLADMTYEGSRSITGPYLGLLGAGAAAVGAVAGAGEMIGYGLRLASGYLTDRTRKYWTLALAGYAVNLLAVPALALAGRWEAAALLIIAERAGKAIRVPARDVMIAAASKSIGAGWGFGVHEAMDRIGGLSGPLIVALVLASTKSYRAGFTVLLVPALAALGVLLAARSRYPQPQALEADRGPDSGGALPRSFWLYLAAAGLVAAGYFDFPLAAFHWKSAGVASDVWIPLLYAFAMGVAAATSLALGKLFDRWGSPVLLAAPLAAALAAPLVFSNGFSSALAGMVFWGVGLGTQNSVLRAAVAKMAPSARRGSAYGIFNTVYGVCWFAGSALMGVLYETSALRLVVFSVCAQLAAVPLLLLLGRFTRAKRPAVIV